MRNGLVNRKASVCLIVLLVICMALFGCTENKDNAKAPEKEPEKSDTQTALLRSAKDIDLRDIDGGGTNYIFDYDGKQFRAVYSYDTWTVYDSYKIINEDDIKLICRALTDVHPVHGSDMRSYRTEEDMAYEWLQHSMAYVLLPKDDPMRSYAKDVDLDPADQGRSFKEIYEDRTGKKFELL